MRHYTSAGSVGERNDSEADWCWRVDKGVVMRGGCVTIEVHETCSRLGNLTLQIDDREPMDLLSRAGVTIQYTTAQGVVHTLVLVSHDFLSPDRFELVSDDPPTYRMLPVFNDPGPVRLILRAGDRSLGTEVVTVVPASPEAQPAVDLLFPKHIHNQGPVGDRATSMRLLVSAAHGASVRTEQPELARYQRELQVLRQHPDWGEIFQMLVARLEARVRGFEYLETLKEAGHDLDRLPEVPPISDDVRKALQTQVKSPFAKVIQDTLRNAVKLPQSMREHPEFVLNQQHGRPGNED